MVKAVLLPDMKRAAAGRVPRPGKGEHKQQRRRELTSRLDHVPLHELEARADAAAGGEKRARRAQRPATAGKPRQAARDDAAGGSTHEATGTRVRLLELQQQQQAARLRNSSRSKMASRLARVLRDSEAETVDLPARQKHAKKLDKHAQRQAAASKPRHDAADHEDVRKKAAGPGVLDQQKKPRHKLALQHRMAHVLGRAVREERGSGDDGFGSADSVVGDDDDYQASASSEGIDVDFEDADNSVEDDDDDEEDDRDHGDGGGDDDNGNANYSDGRGSLSKRIAHQHQTARKQWRETDHAKLIDKPSKRQARKQAKKLAKKLSTPGRAKQELQDLFAGLSSRREAVAEAAAASAEVEAEAASATSAAVPGAASALDAVVADVRGDGQRGRKIDPESGLPLYTEQELGLDKNLAGGGTPLCPFDCDCCF